MRLLFYTATGLFLVLAAIFAFYALQTTGGGGSARVVLHIDPEARNTESADRLASADVDPFDSRLPGAQEPAPQESADPDRLPIEEQPLRGRETSANERERISALSSPSDNGSPTASQVELAAAPEEASEPVVEPVPEENASKATGTVEASGGEQISGDLFDRAPSAEESAAFISGVDPRLLEETPSQQDKITEPVAQANPERLRSIDEEPSADGIAEDVASSKPDASLNASAPNEPSTLRDELADLRGSALTEEPRLPSDNSADVQTDAEARSISESEPAGVVPSAEPLDPAQNIETVDAVPAPEATDPSSAGDAEPSRLAALSAAPDDRAASSPQDADAPRNEEDLRKKFDAFLTTLNERRDAETSAAATLLSPPVPRRRPDDIPAPIRTAAAAGWAGNQFSTTDASASGGGARVAIMLRGVGRDDRNSEKAITELPSAVSLAFMPFAGGAQQWARRARQSGHEVIVQLPLEPSDYPLNNPGAETLLSGSSAGENLSRMREILYRFDSYSGVSNYLGGKLLQSEAALRPILERIKSDGLIYVGEGNNSHALLRRLAAEIGLRYGGADIMIDSFPAPDAIKKQLDRLAEIARKQGSAIGMGYASRTTIEQVREWSKSAAAKGITLVPIGALAQTPGAS